VFITYLMMTQVQDWRPRVVTGSTSTFRATSCRYSRTQYSTVRLITVVDRMYVLFPICLELLDFTSVLWHKKGIWFTKIPTLRFLLYSYLSYSV